MMLDAKPSSLRLVPALALGLLVSACANTSRADMDAAAALLPLPVSAVPAKGSFAVTAGTPISALGGGAARGAAERFAELMRRTSGLLLTAGDEQAAGGIAFREVPGMKPESYSLEVKPSGATVTASDQAGLFYGGVTLWQLLTRQGAGNIVEAQAVIIDDAPRFAWRGLMLDSARHFQSPEYVKRLIDWMSAHKLNILHWHLVDDQGWRIEIKKYPRLTGIGAWRVPAGEAPLADIDPATGRPRQIGGFYTQDQIRDIVAYARARSITIVPEIEMPGHALSAIRAYPALGTMKPPVGIESHWGVFPYLYNVEDRTFAFLEDVLGEVLDLFPGTFIHVGGDEAVKDQWKASPAVQAKMRELGISSENAMQSWFIGRIGKYLEARGRRLVGWDEILDGGIPANATVMSWRGIDGAIKAAQAGHDAVLAAAPTLYFDHLQGGTSSEPPGRGGVITLADVYAFDPAPDTLTSEQQRHILGVQGNLWTEHVRTEERAAHMAFPRASAVAEVGWSATEGRSFGGFVQRLVPQLDRLSMLGLAAAPSAFQPEAKERFDPSSNRVSVILANQVRSEIRYTLDGSAPMRGSERYAGALDLRLPTRLRALAFHDGKPLPGAFDRTYDAASVRSRDDTQLKTCTKELVLSLEDDAPIAGPRAAFLIDIMKPCWIYEQAPMDDVAAIEVTVGQLPFNFQIGKDIEKIRFRTPRTAYGEVEVRADGCEGDPVAILPLQPAAANPALTTLRASLPSLKGAHDLCFTYTAKGVEPMWAIDAVQLVTSAMAAGRGSGQ
jgi:hexosaminidase